MSAAVSSPAVSSSAPTFACIRCSQRKVRCDKRSPCTACVRHNVQCVFRPQKQSRKERQSAKQGLLERRLKHYEVLLQANGLDPNRIIDTPENGIAQNRSSEMPRAAEEVLSPDAAPEIQATVFKPQLLHGQNGTKFVDNLWSRVAEEIHDAEDISDDDSVDDDSDRETIDGDFSNVLGLRSPSNLFQHPPADHIRQLWRSFVENVNPVTKIVHVPSLQPAIEKAILHLEHIPRSFEALMFAIYSIATVSLTDDECKDNFDDSRSRLISRFVAATKAALYRARFMSSTSIVVLQALMFHILSIRCTEEPRALWVLSGVALRIAESMGMRVDGTLLGLSPFEVEIRRRIWFQLMTHDFRAAELCGQAKFRDFGFDETTPKAPANIDDKDLYPGMSKAAPESDRPTEMIWCMLRSEMCSFLASQKAITIKPGKCPFTSEDYVALDDLKTKNEWINRIEDLIERKYLRFCDPSQPLQFLTLVGARLSINLVRFMAHHPRRWANLDSVPVAEQDFVRGIATQMLEQYDMMQSSPQLQRFAWNVPYYIQWHAVIHVLDTLRVEPLHIDAERAWRLIDRLYENNSDMLLSTNRPIFVAVGGLCLRAFSARENALGKDQKPLPLIPGYIKQLREQRELTRARRERQKTLESEKRATTATQNPIDSSGEPPVILQAQGSAPTGQQAVPAQGSLLQSGDDAFWLSDTINDGLFAGGESNMMQLDGNAMLAQDYWIDTPSSGTIDWAQWDMWLGALGTLHPN